MSHQFSKRTELAGNDKETELEMIKQEERQGQATETESQAIVQQVQEKENMAATAGGRKRIAMQEATHVSSSFLVTFIGF
jgi:uncharacterized membrane protein